MLEDFDPNTIQDEALRQVVISLMNLVETLHAKVQEQAEEIQRLRDENNRLKGEQGRPDIKPNKPATALFAYHLGECSVSLVPASRPGVWLPGVPALLPVFRQTPRLRRHPLVPA
jgi:hypothetical protein